MGERTVVSLLLERVAGRTDVSHEMIVPRLVARAAPCLHDGDTRRKVYAIAIAGSQS